MTSARKANLKRDIVDYIVIAMAISALLALLLDAMGITIIALVIIALAEAFEIPNTAKRVKYQAKQPKENK